MKVLARKVIALGFVLIFGLPGMSQAQKLVVGYSGITAIQRPGLMRIDFFRRDAK